MNGHDKLPIGVCKPSTEKVIELPQRGAENIIDILNAEPKPTKCMVLPLCFLIETCFLFKCVSHFWRLSIFFSLIEGSDIVNFNEELAHVPLPSGSQCFPSVGWIPSFGKDLFDSRSRLDDSKVFVPRTMTRSSPFVEPMLLHSHPTHIARWRLHEWDFHLKQWCYYKGGR